MKDIERRLDRLEAAHGNEGIGAALDALAGGPNLPELDIHPALAAVLDALPDPKRR